MSLILGDRIRQTSTTTGSGTLTLDGTVTGFQSFSAVGEGNTTYYTIALDSQWEVGIGTYSAGTLSRDTVLSSSTGSIIAFAAGAKDVFVSYPAEKSVNQDANNRVLIPYTSGVTNVGSLNVGNTTSHTDSGVIAGFTASEPLYLYTSLQNTSTANTSYASYAVNDGGHTAYAELGINNSTYSYTAAGFPNNGFSTPLASFVESYGGPLVIGSWDNQKISFITNGAVNTTDAMTINTNGSISFNGQVGTAGQVLQSNATSAPTWVTPAGGSSTLTISNKTAAYTVVAGDLGTVINCTSGTFTVSLTAAATLATGFNVQINNTGTGTITIDPSGAETIDNNTTWQLSKGQGVRILCDGTNFQTIAIRTSGQAANTVALGNNSGGGASVAITGGGAMALGGSYASGTDSFAAAIANNTSTYGAQSANSVAIGAGLAKASAARALALMNNAIASGTDSIAIGIGCNATAANATAIGYGAVAAQIGKIAITGSAIASTGQSQIGFIVLLGATTSATPFVLNSTNATANATNQLVLSNNQAMSFEGTIVARQQAAGGTASAAWKIEGLIRREGTAASTTLVASTVTAISNVPTWVIALTADTTNGALAVTATGAAATNIRWAATIQSTELVYA